MASFSKRQNRGQNKNPKPSNYWVNRGLRHLFVGGNPIDLVSPSYALVADSGNSYSATQGGLAFNFNGSTDGFKTPAYTDLGAVPFTFLALCVPGSTSAGSHNIASSGNGAQYAWQLRRDAGTWNYYQFDGSDKNVTDASGVTAGKLTSIAISWDWNGITGNMRLFRDGVLKGTTTAVNNKRTDTVLKIGEDNFGAKQAWDGQIILAAYFTNVSLTVPEIVFLQANPWQLIAPSSRKLYVNSVAAAGGVVGSYYYRQVAGMAGTP
jgi:hypothetical protein